MPTPSSRLVQIVLLAAGLAFGPPAAYGQDVDVLGDDEDAPLLFLVNERTTVGNISFEFIDGQTFDASRLAEQIALTEPSTLDRIRRTLPFLSPAPHPFAPLVLQRDVVRLRNFYRQNGFLKAQIDYAQTRLDTTNNRIDVVFDIREGPPVIIQDVGFFTQDTSDYAVSQFAGDLRERWIDFRDANTFQTGERYTDFERLRIEDVVLRWLRNQGFAFAETGAAVALDSTYNTADIRFIVDAGPRARVDSIQIEGTESVSRQVALRELPLKEGEWFSADELSRGQRQLFSLNLFRLALADVPEQPRDSTVTLRYRVREASLRYITAETGYARTVGVATQGQWTHRNFFGAARTLSASALANTGLFASTGDGAIRSSNLYRGSLTLNQPYLFSNNLSLIVSPFLQFEKSAFLAENDELPLGINTRQYGNNTTLVYEWLPFRTASLQHTYSNTQTFTEELVIDSLAIIQTPGDQYNRSILSLSATLGRADDYLNPSRGYLVRPLLEVGGGPLQGAIDYRKASLELTGYLPLTDRISLAGRLIGGSLFYDTGLVTRDSSGAWENRFDPIRFYAGGPNDVRGWAVQQAGEKSPVLDVVLRDSADPPFEEADVDTLGIVYEPVGGRYKLGYNVEGRFPFPGLGSSWGTAVFLDAGMVNDAAAIENFRYGAGVGLRYRTPVGYLRLDLAAKLNPTPRDLARPREYYEWSNGSDGSDALDTHWLRRFRLHISIGQAY